MQLYAVLPKVITHFLELLEERDELTANSALEEIKAETANTKRSILDQITFENYSYYLGFDEL